MEINNKLRSNILRFVKSVGKYIQMEYDSVYYKEYMKSKNASNIFDFVGSYYMGGSNVPDTARYTIEFIHRFVLS